MRTRLGIAFVGRQLARNQVVGQGVDVVAFFRMPGEFACHLAAAVFAPGQQVDCARAQTEFLHATARLPSQAKTPGATLSRHSRWTAGKTQASTAIGAAGLRTPTFSRTSASISAASSGCSRRYSRTLSLPWPIRSLLYEYQAPAFSTMPCCTPS